MDKEEFGLTLFALSICRAFHFKGCHRIFSLKTHHRFSDLIKTAPSLLENSSTDPLRREASSTMPSWPTAIDSCVCTAVSFPIWSRPLISLMKIRLFRLARWIELLSVYRPKGSSTSKKVTCNNLLFEHHNRCPGTFSDCSCMVSYVSAQTSTSGILVEDVLHLATGDTNGLVEAYVTFG